MSAAAADMAWHWQYTMPHAPLLRQQQFCTSAPEQAGSPGRPACWRAGKRAASASRAPGSRARAPETRLQCRCGRATSSGGCTGTRAQRRRKTPTRGRTPAGRGQGGHGGSLKESGQLKQHSRAGALQLALQNGNKTDSLPAALRRLARWRGLAELLHRCLLFGCQLPYCPLLGCQISSTLTMGEMPEKR